MNKILQKCLDELNKEPFKIDKVIGMLETLIEMSGGSVNKNTSSGSLKEYRIPSDEWSGLDTSIPESYVTKPGPVAQLH